MLSVLLNKYSKECSTNHIIKQFSVFVNKRSFVRADFLKLDDAVALILLSFCLIVDSFLLNFLQRDVNLSSDFNRSRISNFSSNDINFLLSLSFLEIYGVMAGKYFLLLTSNIVKKDCFRDVEHFHIL